MPSSEDRKKCKSCFREIGISSKRLLSFMFIGLVLGTLVGSMGVGQFRLQIQKNPLNDEFNIIVGRFSNFQL
jgi:hypothetical protein